ncbi:MAG: hypothetical protein PHV59_03700 [Victivallales bacterium]|nr:hypothetical protein [Victivallales bacterium]
MNMPLLSQEMRNIMIGFCFCLAFAGIAVYLAKYRFKKPCRRKRRIIIALSVTGVIVAYFVFYTVSNLLGRAQVEAGLAQMKSLNIPTTAEAILPAPPQDHSKNAAYFFKAAFALLEADDSLAKLYDMESKFKTFNIAEWSDPQQQAAKKLLNSKNIDMVFYLFSRGAEKPYLVYEREFRGVGTLLPEFSFRNLFRLIYMKSSNYGLAGKADSGYKLIRDGYKAIIQSFSEPYLISQLVNIACASINTQALNALILQHGISTAKAQEILKLLDRLDFNRGMQLSIEVEIILLQKDTLEGLMNGKCPLQESLIPVWPFLYQDYVYGIRQSLKIRAILAKPYWEIKSELENWKRESKSPMFIVSEIFLDGFSPLPEKTARINTEVAAAKLTLALHIFKNKTGHFPEKLVELSPAILKEIPLDPLTGQPFEYKKQNGAFNLDAAWLKMKRKPSTKHQ